MVIIPMGMNSITFNLDAIQDFLTDGTQTVTLTAKATDFYVDGCNAFMLANNVNTAAMMELPPGSGIYKVEYWRPEGVIPFRSITINDGTPEVVPADTFQPVCTRQKCELENIDIPRLESWGLIALALLLSIFGIVGLSQNSLSKISISKRYKIF